MAHSTVGKALPLMEMAVVLSIIALIVGGILLGKDLHATARNRAIIKEFDSYQYAIGLFKNKYSYYPGDLPNPEKYWPSATWKPTCYPNGDGAVNWVMEGPLAWRELQLSNIISQSAIPRVVNQYSPWDCSYMALPGKSIPASKVIPDAGWTLAVSKYLRNNMLLFGKKLYPNTEWTPELASFGAISAKDTFYIDSKIDDGDPQVGNLRAHTGIMYGQPSPYSYKSLTECLARDSSSPSGYRYQKTATGTTWGCSFYAGLDL